MVGLGNRWRDSYDVSIVYRTTGTCKVQSRPQALTRYLRTNLES